MSHVYDFDKGVDRRGTDAKKFDPSLCPDDVLPFWIADSEFQSPVEPPRPSTSASTCSTTVTPTSTPLSRTPLLVGTRFVTTPC